DRPPHVRLEALRARPPGRLQLALAGSSQRPRRRRSSMQRSPHHSGRHARTWTVPLLLLATAFAPAAAADPILFPPTPRGPAAWRDERDVAPWLAAWKAEALRRTRALRAASTPNQQSYDVTSYDLDLAFTPPLPHRSRP